jgi:hypothetical protein
MIETGKLVGFPAAASEIHGYCIPAIPGKNPCHSQDIASAGIPFQTVEYYSRFPGSRGCNIQVDEIAIRCVNPFSRVFDTLDASKKRRIDCLHMSIREQKWWCVGGIGDNRHYGFVSKAELGNHLLKKEISPCTFSDKRSINSDPGYVP